MTTATNSDTTTAIDTAMDSLVIKLRPASELTSMKRRFYFAEEAGDMFPVVVTANNEFSCRCKRFYANLKTSSGPCPHAEEAMGFVEELGFGALPTWTVTYKGKQTGNRFEFNLGTFPRDIPCMRSN